MKQALTNAASFLLELGSYDEDDLKVLRFDSTERLSDPFTLHVELASRDPHLDFDSIVGQPAAFTMRGPEGDRFLHGVVAEFEQGSATAEHYFYEVVVRPRLWLLDSRINCRIFQSQDIQKIITTVLQEHGLLAGQDFEFRLAGVHPTREYCVQYRESDLAFISRLLEEEGVFYAFVSDPDRSKLVFGDSSSVHEDIDGDPELRMAPPGGLVSPDLAEQVFDLRFSQRVCPGAFATTDYEFKQPTLDLLASQQADRNAELEVFEFPGEYVEPAVGRALAQVRLEEQQARRKETRGSSNCLRFFPGGEFDLVDHPRDDFNHGYLVTEVRQKGASPQALEEDAVLGSEPRYSNTFVAIPDTVPYRPARKTPRPYVHGTQTAVVVGPAGEEIYCDEHSRVKVQFFWDRYGRSDHQSSCWIRVSQPWAGPGMGGLAIPRIGQEVVIDFLEGDPDRPIMVGRVYNADLMPPQDLPGGKSNMTIRSQSLGGSGGFNEISLNDTGGQEGFFMHAQYDMTEVVQHDRSRTVHNNETIQVDVDRSKTVSNNETTSIGVDRTEDVGSNETVTIGADRTHDVGVNETTTVGANQSLTVGSNQTVQVGAMANEMVGAAKTTTVGAAYALTVAGAMNVAVGLLSAEEVGLAKKIIAGSSIELKCGASSIKLESSGKITIQGTEIAIDGSAHVKVTSALIDLN